MTGHAKGYSPSEEKLAAINANKEAEERVLRHFDTLASTATPGAVDGHWFGIARDHITQGFMALNRAVGQPGRVSLPEDKSA